MAGEALEEFLVKVASDLVHTPRGQDGLENPGRQPGWIGGVGRHFRSSCDSTPRQSDISASRAARRPATPAGVTA